MRRIFLIFMALLFLFSAFNINTYAVGPEIKELPPVKVSLNGKTLKFDVQPTIIDSRTMVPMRAIFEYFGATVEWYGETRTVRAHKDNDYIKLVIDSKTAYKNGKEFKLDVSPTIIDGRTLVPVRFIGESLGVEVGWDNKTRTVVLKDSNQDDDNTITYDLDTESLLIKIKDYNLEFLIPADWTVVDSKNYEFEYVDKENDVQLDISMIDLDQNVTLKKFTEDDKLAIYGQYKNSVVFTGNNDVTINDIDMHVEYLKFTSLDSSINQVKYYFITEGTGFIVTFSYVSNSNDSQLQEIFRDIMHTFMKTEKMVDTNTEHYMEYDQFFKKGFVLESEIYSNMEAKNSIKFKGSLKENLAYLFVQVGKGNEKIELQIPVKDKKFDYNIPTPFGLGKHDIIIGTPIDKNNLTNYILQFSVVNTRDEYLRYLIPSRLVNSDDKEIISLAQETTKGFYSEYAKAFEILKWISNNIDYDLSTDDSPPRNAKQTYLDKKGDCDEISYLYAALLRASDIPAKIVASSSEGEFHAWNEVQINGKWQIVDPTWASGYMNDETGEYVKEFDIGFFGPNKASYLSKFDGEVEYLPY